VNVGLQQRNDLAVPDQAKRVFSSTPVSFRALRRQALGLVDAPGAAFTDACLGSGGDLAVFVAVLLVHVHLVVRDDLARHAASLRCVSKALR